MAVVNTAPKLSKNRKLGKNKKKSWRAAKVEDVQEFLDDERRQIISGGLVSEKTDETLFVVDKGTKSDFKLEPKSRLSYRTQQLRCTALLQPDPHSKVVRKPDPATFKKGKRSQRLIELQNEQAKSHVRLQAALQRKQWEEEKKKKQEIKKQIPQAENLWTDGADDSLAVKGKPRGKNSTKTSALSATPIPHPGTSINPAFDDHQNLLQLAHLKEVVKVKNEKRLYRSLDAKFPTLANAPDETTYLVEMSAGLLGDSDDDSEDVGNEVLSANPPVRREDRKTRKQKRIQKELEDLSKQKNLEECKKKRENMILRIPTLKSEINKEERLKKEREALKRKLKEEEKFKTKRLGQVKFEEPDLELKLSTELVASYREVKPEGNPMVEIYKNLQRRNIVEPRVRQKVKRKYRPKVFEKKGHKSVKL